MLSTTEIQKLEEITSCLGPLFVAVNALSKNDCNLAEADRILEFCLDQLELKDSALSRKLYANLLSRIKMRRDPKMSTLACYLNGYIDFDDITQLDYISKDECFKFAKNLHEKIFPNSIISNLVEPDMEEIPSQNLQQKLNDYLTPKKLRVSGCQECIGNSLENFETTKMITDNLQIFIDAINTIQGTSTIAERVFSIAGNFVRRRRASIGDELLNALLILNYKI